MAARLIASFSRADAEALGGVRWGELCKSLLPALRILANASVWMRVEGDVIQVLAAPTQDDGPSTWPVTDISEVDA